MNRSDTILREWIKQTAVRTVLFGIRDWSGFSTLYLLHIGVIFLYGGVFEFVFDYCVSELTATVSVFSW